MRIADFLAKKRHNFSDRIVNEQIREEKNSKKVLEKCKYCVKNIKLITSFFRFSFFIGNKGVKQVYVLKGAVHNLRSPTVRGCSGCRNVYVTVFPKV